MRAYRPTIRSYRFVIEGAGAGADHNAKQGPANFLLLPYATIRKENDWKRCMLVSGHLWNQASNPQPHLKNITAFTHNLPFKNMSKPGSALFLFFEAQLFPNPISNVPRWCAYKGDSQWL